MNQAMKLILKIRYCIHIKYETIYDSHLHVLFVGPHDYYWEHLSENKTHYIKEMRNPDKTSYFQVKLITIKQLPDSIKNFLKATWLAI